MKMVIELESPNPFQTTTRSDLFNKHVGSTQWWSELTQNKRKPRIAILCESLETTASEL